MSKTPQGCSIVVHDKNNRILVQLRDDSVKYHPSVHALFGGGINQAEEQYLCAERKLHEGLGFTNPSLKYVGLNDGGHYVYAQQVTVLELDRMANEPPKEGLAAVIVNEQTIHDFEFAPTHKAVIEYFWNNFGRK